MTDPTQTQTTPATTPDAAKTTPQTPPDPQNDPVALAKRVGELEAENAQYKDFKTKVDPVLETLYSDQELLAQATAIHNKRIGIKTPESQSKTPQTPAVNPADTDTRMAVINQRQEEFEKKVGIDKLPEDKKQSMRGMLGQMIKEMVDPKGNKTIQQAFEEISAVKFPWYLQRAYDLVNRDSEIESARTAGKNEVMSQYEGERGKIGSMVGGSVPLENVTLTPQEKSTAAKMGIPEDKYLQNKKDILQLRG